MKKFLFLIALVTLTVNAKVEIRSKLPWMKNLGSVVNCVIALPEFQKEVGAIESFTFTKDNGKQVVEKLGKVSTTFSTYRSKNPWSKATSYTLRKEVYFNLRNNPRPLPRMLNTGIHEALHVAGYGHGNNNIDNDTVNKMKSVPYGVGLIAEKYVEKCKGGVQ